MSCETPIIESEEAKTPIMNKDQEMEIAYLSRYLPSDLGFTEEDLRLIQEENDAERIKKVPITVKKQANKMTNQIDDLIKEVDELFMDDEARQQSTSSSDARKE